MAVSPMFTDGKPCFIQWTKQQESRNGSNTCRKLWRLTCWPMRGLRIRGGVRVRGFISGSHKLHSPRRCSPFHLHPTTGLDSRTISYFIRGRCFWICIISAWSSQIHLLNIAACILTLATMGANQKTVKRPANHYIRFQFLLFFFILVWCMNLKVQRSSVKTDSSQIVVEWMKADVFVSAAACT